MCHGMARLIFLDGFCCRSSVAYWGSCPGSVPYSSPGAGRACSCPSPKGWYRASRVRSLGFYRMVFVGLCGYCSVDLIVWVVRSNQPAAMDVDVVRCLHVPVRQTCSICVSGSAACALEGRNLEVCLSLRILLQVLSRMSGQLSWLCSLIQSGSRAGLLVSFPEGMVSYKPGQEFGLLPYGFCRVMWLMQC